MLGIPNLIELFIVPEYLPQTYSRIMITIYLPGVFFLSKLILLWIQQYYLLKNIFIFSSIFSIISGVLGLTYKEYFSIFLLLSSFFHGINSSTLFPLLSYRGKYKYISKSYILNALILFVTNASLLIVQQITYHKIWCDKILWIIYSIYFFTLVLTLICISDDDFSPMPQKESSIQILSNLWNCIFFSEISFFIIISALLMLVKKNMQNIIYYKKYDYSLKLLIITISELMGVFSWLFNVSYLDVIISLLCIIVFYLKYTIFFSSLFFKYYFLEDLLFSIGISYIFYSTNLKLSGYFFSRHRNSPYMKYISLLKNLFVSIISLMTSNIIKENLIEFLWITFIISLVSNRIIIFYKNKKF